MKSRTRLQSEWTSPFVSLVELACWQPWQVFCIAVLIVWRTEKWNWSDQCYVQSRQKSAIYQPALLYFLGEPTWNIWEMGRERMRLFWQCDLFCNEHKTELELTALISVEGVLFCRDESLTVITIITGIIKKTTINSATPSPPPPSTQFIVRSYWSACCHWTDVCPLATRWLYTRNSHQLWAWAE